MNPMQALLKALHDRCLYTDAGWWTFELCWGSHLRQFHAPGLDAEQKLESVHLLGVLALRQAARLSPSSLLSDAAPTKMQAARLSPSHSRAALK